MVRRTTVLLLATLMLAASAFAADNWKVDPVHSSVEFKVSHMVVGKVEGKFTDFDGTIDFDGKDLVGGTVTFTVQVNSVNTGNDKRDGHLRSPDFFDVEKYPTMTFTSKKVIPGEGNSFKLIGDLSMKDVTKEVTFDCEFNGTMSDSQGNQRAGFSATTTINRQDYNISWDRVMDTGGLVAGNNVNITLDLEAVKPAS